MDAIIRRWPGKSPGVAGGIAHPAVYHMLDVAAVAEVLIGRFDHAPPLREALVLLAALHDLGKIGAPFRAMLTFGAPQPHPHWEMTEVLLAHHDARLARRLGARPHWRFALYAAVSGYHSRPSVLEDLGAGPLVRSLGDEALRDAGAVIAAVAALWPGASLEAAGKDEITGLS